MFTLLPNLFVLRLEGDEYGGLAPPVGAPGESPKAD